jgi:predicted metal-dependent hydrolase
MNPKIIRSNRKTIALIVQSDASLLVRAPHRVPREKIDELIKSHQEWIEKRQQRAKARLASIPSHQYKSGERFLYLGKEYPLKIIQAAEEPLTFNNGFCLIDSWQKHGEYLFTFWYRWQAKRLFSEHAKACSHLTGIEYSAVKVSNAKKRWGSCSSAGNLNLNWRLIMAPPQITDYVIIHELAHRKHMDHSKEFWSLVESYCPDYRKHLAWLKKNGHVLTLS